MKTLIEQLKKAKENNNTELVHFLYDKIIKMISEESKPDIMAEINTIIGSTYWWS